MVYLMFIPLLLAVFLSVNMGGSGVAPSFSAAYGSGIIKKSRIPFLFGSFVFAGALIAGHKVIDTIGKGLLPQEEMTITLTSIVLFSVGCSLFIANLLGVPQSTSQSTVFALIGPAGYLGVLKSHKLIFEIIPVWFVLPVIAGFLSYCAGKIFYGTRLSTITDNFKNTGRHKAIQITVIAASCYVAFAIGSNNVANAAGPLASMVSGVLGGSDGAMNYGMIAVISTLVVAPCFGIGSVLLGERGLRTVGKGITGFGPTGAILISSITASLLLLASLSRGIPASLVQLNTAAIIGLGIAKKGHREVMDSATVRRICTIWIIAPLIALVLSFGLTWIADLAGVLGG